MIDLANDNNFFFYNLSINYLLSEEKKKKNYENLELMKMIDLSNNGNLLTICSMIMLHRKPKRTLVSYITLRNNIFRFNDKPNGNQERMIIHELGNNDN